MLDDGPTLVETSDAALVVAIREGRGHAEAETELCGRYRQRAYLYGLRHLRDAAAAEDLAQSALTTLIERARAGAVSEPDKVGAFVLGICRLQALERRRLDARRARILARYGDARAGVAATEAPAIERADLARVRDCLAQLPDRDRTVLLLSFYAELDAEALANELGLRSSHVRVVRHRALARLQSCVRGSEEEP